MIKLPPLSSSDKAFAVRIPGHTGKTVFVGLGHLGPQLPRLAKNGTRRGRRNTEKEMGEGRERAKGRVSKSGGGMSKKKRGRGGEGEKKRSLSTNSTLQGIHRTFSLGIRLMELKWP